MAMVGRSAGMASMARVAGVFRFALVESYPAHMVTNLPGNFFVTDFLSGASGHVIVTAELNLVKK